MYETFEHTADIGLRARGETLERLFVEAARGLFSILCANPESIERMRTIAFEVPYEEGAWDDLLFDFLAELLYRFDTEHLLLAAFDVALDADRLRATAQGEGVDASRHELDMDVKAITYHGLRVEQEAEGGWLAEVIVDL